MLTDLDYLRFLHGRHKTVGVSRRTWRRWFTGQARIPSAVLQLARILSGGELDAMGGPAWSGWKIVRGKLYDPSGVEHSPASIEAWHWTRMELDALRSRENRGEPEELPGGVAALPGRRRAHQVATRMEERVTSSKDQPANNRRRRAARS